MELDGVDDENFSFHEFLGGYEKLLTENFLSSQNREGKKN